MRACAQPRVVGGYKMQEWPAWVAHLPLGKDHQDSRLKIRLNVCVPRQGKVNGKTAEKSARTNGSPL